MKTTYSKVSIDFLITIYLKQTTGGVPVQRGDAVRAGEERGELAGRSELLHRRNEDAVQQDHGRHPHHNQQIRECQVIVTCTII